MENGYTWSVELDIHSFFDNINQDFLINKIQNHISDDKILNLIITYLKCTVIDDHTTCKKDEGILQGGQLSPLFSNIYMNELDHYMDENDYHFCRFGDDINIYCKTYDDGMLTFGGSTGTGHGRVEVMKLNVNGMDYTENLKSGSMGFLEGLHEY